MRMAARILTDIPDDAVHRDDPLAPMHERIPQRPVHSPLSRISGRAWFAAGTVGLHVVALVAFMNAQQIETAILQPEPMVVSLVAERATSVEQPRDIAPPPQDVTFMLAPPQDLAYETETIAPPVAVPAITESAATAFPPAVVASVEYLRAPAPAYPAESSRRRERGTVLLRVLVDAQGRPAQVLVERSSGYARLDDAARSAVEDALF